MKSVKFGKYDDQVKPLLKKNENETPFKTLLFYGCIIISPCLIGGMSMSYSAIALPQMNLNIDDASWFGSLPFFGSPIGSILTGLIIDKFGRRPAILISVMPDVLGWLLLILDFERTTTFTGRILTGLNTGCLFIGQVYASECIIVNHPDWRTSLIVCQGMALSLGGTLTYILNCFLPFQQVAAVAAALSCILMLLTYLYIPESPIWLCHKGLVEKAKRSERQLGIHQPILKEIGSKVTVLCSNEASDISTMIQKLVRKDVYKPLIIITILYFLVLFSGSPVITAYMVDIITVGAESGKIGVDVGTISNDPRYDLGLISSILSATAVLLLTFVTPHCGMKKVYYLSALGMAMFLCILGASDFHFDDEYVQNLVNTMHVVSVWCITFFSAFGVYSIPTSIMGEIFPHDAKGFASIPAVVLCLCSGLAVKFHPYLFLYFGGIVYVLYASLLFLSVIFFGVFLPETVGKSLDEIGCFFSA